jgi:hypothetical protein
VSHAASAAHADTANPPGAGEPWRGLRAGGWNGVPVRWGTHTVREGGVMRGGSGATGKGFFRSLHRINMLSSLHSVPFQAGGLSQPPAFMACSATPPTEAATVCFYRALESREREVSVCL